MSSSAQRDARHGRKPQRCRSEKAARQAARRVAAPCWETTPVPGKTPVQSGTETIGFEMRLMAHHRSRTARWKARAGSRGESLGCCMQAWVFWLWASLSTSLAPETRVSRRRRCGWWVLRSSWPASHAVCCVLPSAYSRSPAADGGPTTRRAEDWMVAGRAKQCPWPVAPAWVPRNVRPRVDSTRPLATCRASPVARKTNACADTARPPRRRRLRIPRLLISNRAQYSRSRCSRSRRLRRRRRRRWCRQWRQRAGRPLATSPSPAGPTASSCSVPRSCAHNPQAINDLAISPPRTPQVYTRWLKLMSKPICRS